jgi:hypothetical protein
MSGQPNSHGARAAVNALCAQCSAHPHIADRPAMLAASNQTLTGTHGTEHGQRDPQQAPAAAPSQASRVFWRLASLRGSATLLTGCRAGSCYLPSCLA